MSLRKNLKFVLLSLAQRKSTSIILVLLICSFNWRRLLWSWSFSTVGSHQWLVLVVLLHLQVLPLLVTVVRVVFSIFLCFLFMDCWRSLVFIWRVVPFDSNLTHVSTWCAALSMMRQRPWWTAWSQVILRPLLWLNGSSLTEIGTWVECSCRNSDTSWRQLRWHHAMIRMCIVHWSEFVFLIADKSLDELDMLIVIIIFFFFVRRTFKVVSVLIWIRIKLRASLSWRIVDWTSHWDKWSSVSLVKSYWVMHLRSGKATVLATLNRYEWGLHWKILRSAFWSRTLQVDLTSLSWIVERNRSLMKRAVRRLKWIHVVISSTGSEIVITSQILRCIAVARESSHIWDMLLVIRKEELLLLNLVGRGIHKGRRRIGLVGVAVHFIVLSCELLVWEGLLDWVLGRLLQVGELAWEHKRLLQLISDVLRQDVLLHFVRVRCVEPEVAHVDLSRGVGRPSIQALRIGDVDLRR